MQLKHNRLTVTIITINYNNAEGLLKTLTSVIEQSYKNIEYIVIDGGSSDESLDIIKQREANLSYWVSEPDSGIYNAMNKGIKKASGEYILFLNSGDVLCHEDVLHEFWELVKDKSDLLFGDLKVNKLDKIDIFTHPDLITFQYFLKGYTITHPSTFIKRTLFDRLGLYNEQNKIVSDWEFFIRAICLFNCSYLHVPYVVSEFAMDGISSQAVNAKNIENEKLAVYNKHFKAFMPDYKRLEKIDEIFTFSRVIKVLKKMVGKRWEIEQTPLGSFTTYKDDK